MSPIKNFDKNNLYLCYSFPIIVNCYNLSSGEKTVVKKPSYAKVYIIYII